jgi:hypothetical protein
LIVQISKSNRCKLHCSEFYIHLFVILLANKGDVSEIAKQIISAFNADAFSELEA